MGDWSPGFCFPVADLGPWGSRASSGVGLPLRFGLGLFSPPLLPPAGVSWEAFELVSGFWASVEFCLLAPFSLELGWAVSLEADDEDGSLELRLSFCFELVSEEPPSLREVALDGSRSDFRSFSRESLLSLALDGLPGSLGFCFSCCSLNSSMRSKASPSWDGAVLGVSVRLVLFLRFELEPPLDGERLELFLLFEEVSPSEFAPDGPWLEDEFDRGDWLAPDELRLF